MSIKNTIGNANIGNSTKGCSDGDLERGFCEGDAHETYERGLDQPMIDDQDGSIMLAERDDQGFLRRPMWRGDIQRN